MSEEPQFAAEPTRPLLRVVHGDPTPEELAALVAVLGTRATAPGERPAASRSAWNDPARQVRSPHQHGPGGWRAAALPR